jgi:putative glycosyltransferase (TIGR04372 family)
VWVVRSVAWNRRLRRLAQRPELRHSAWAYATAMYTTARYPAIQAAYAGRPPLLRLTEEHRIRGRWLLRHLGVAEGAWFVCVHCREGGYAAHDPGHGFRDVDVANYLPAMAAVVERGGWCVRMGDPTMRPLPKLAGVVDYAHHPLRCDWMDVFLCAACRFFLGSSSGLCNLASVFGVPSAIANQAPLSVVFPPGAADVGIPKLFWSCAAGRYLTFAELLGGPLGNARYQHQLDEAGVRVVENSPEDIRDLALELLERLQGGLRYSEDDQRRQARFRSLFRPGHYSLGAPSRVGRDFLHKYEWLLGDGGQAWAA